MQGSVGVLVLAVIAAILLVAGSSSLPWVAAVCVASAVAVGIDQRRSRSSR